MKELLVIESNSKLKLNTLNKNLIDYSIGEIKLDEDSIDYSIKMMEKRDKKEGSRIYKKNIRLIKDYLLNIKKIANNNEKVKLTFSVDKEKIRSVPFETKKIPYFGMETIDYINIKDASVVTLDYTELMNAITFDMAYRDLGYNFKEIEDRLKEDTIIGVNENKRLMDIVRESETNYYNIYGMEIVDTPYKTEVTRNHKDYFRNDIKNSKKYKDILEGSFEMVMTRIVEHFLETVSQNKMKLKLAAVYESSFVVVTDNSGDITDRVNHELSIRLFGRLYKFKPEITVY